MSWNVVTPVQIQSLAAGSRPCGVPLDQKRGPGKGQFPDNPLKAAAAAHNGSCERCRFLPFFALYGQIDFRPVEVTPNTAEDDSGRCVGQADAIRPVILSLPQGGLKVDMTTYGKGVDLPVSTKGEHSPRAVGNPGAVEFPGFGRIAGYWEKNCQGKDTDNDP